LEQVAQRGGRYPIPGNIQGQAEWGSEQPDPVEDGSVIAGVLDQMAFKGPFQNKPFYDSMASQGITGGWKRTCHRRKQEEQKAGTVMNCRSGSIRGKMNCRGTTPSWVAVTLTFCLK